MESVLAPTVPETQVNQFADRYPCSLLGVSLTVSPNVPGAAKRTVTSSDDSFVHDVTLLDVFYC